MPRQRSPRTVNVAHLRKGVITYLHQPIRGDFFVPSARASPSVQRAALESRCELQIAALVLLAAPHRRVSSRLQVEPAGGRDVAGYIAQLAILFLAGDA